MNRSLTSLVLTITAVFFFNHPLLAMKKDEEEKISVSINPQNMTREELYKFMLSQQEKLSAYEKYLTPEEKETNRLLNNPLPTQVVLVIDALNLMEKKKCSLEEALNIIENEEEYDDKKCLKKLTPMDVLKDTKNFSNVTARKLFRGLVVGIKEEKTLNLRRYAHLGPDLKMGQWIVCILSQPSHIVKVMYPNESVTACLIKTYLDTRKDQYWRVVTKLYTFGMF